MRMNELKIKENESNQEFGIRLYSNKVEYGLSNKDIYEIYTKETGDARAESSVRGEFTNLVKGIELGYEKALSDREEDNLLEELEAKRIELEKEKVKYRDQKREYMNFIRQDARWENLKDCLLDEVRKINEEMPLELGCVDFAVSQGNKACLLISDLHIGSLIDTYINKYNMDIAQQRLDLLESKVISYCKLNGVDELNIELLGDLISGNIHVTTRLYNEENIIQQTIKCSEMLGSFISRIANNIPKVNIYYSVGNHGRCVANYKEHLDEENFEYLIKWYLQGRLENLSNIEFKENIFDDEIAIIEVFNKKIASVHGHKDKLKSAIDKLRGFTGIMLNEVHCGHYHCMQIGDGVLVNGCMSGSDKYAQSLRYGNEPSQVLKVYYSNGDECIQNIKL